jgi:LPS sulfotransferase NodH
MTVRLPDFIIGGAPRSGTTYLAEALDRHPGVFVGKPFIPEPKVFFGPARSPAEYADEYSRHFADASPEVALGEKTSNYFENDEACRRIAATLPDTRMVFILREPVGRAYSNYLWSRKNGLETLSFEEAIEREGQRESPLPPENTHARPFDYQRRGDYARFAGRYFEALGRDRVGLFIYEELERQPDRLLREVQRFVGVDPLPFDRLDVGWVNAARDQGPPIDPETERCLRARMAPMVHELAALTGLDVSVWGY